MATKKSIDGLSPRRPKRPASSARANGFTPLVQPRQTRRNASSNSDSSVASSATADTIHPEDFIPPRRTKKAATIAPPELSTPKKSRADITEDFLEPTRAFDFDEETGELVNTKPIEPTREKTKKSAQKPPKKARKKWSKKRKIWTWVGIIFALLLIGGIIWFILWGNDLIARLTNGRSNITDLFTETYEPLRADQNGRTNILAFGTSGFDMQGTDLDQSTHDGAELTDSIMVISFDQNTGDTAMFSIPRDFKVSSSCTSTYKINEVYWCNNLESNDEDAGANALMTEVSDIFGLDINYYAHINWGSLEDVVNALGGINITLDESVNDYGYTNANYEAGVEYHLSGIEAVALARARHGTENGDFSRGDFQQKILIGIKDQITNQKPSIGDLLNLANTLGDNLRTNFSIGEMKTLAHLADTLDLNNVEQISFLEPEPLMTTADIYGISYVIPSAGDGDYSDIQAYLAKMLASDPRLREDVSILVLNATGQPGVAATAQTALKDDGYTDVAIDDAPAGDYAAGYTLYSLTDTAPATLEFLESKYSTTALPATSLPAGIPTGYSFVLIIGSVPTD